MTLVNLSTEISSFVKSVTLDFLGSFVETIQVTLVQVIDTVPADFLDYSESFGAILGQTLWEAFHSNSREVLGTSELKHHRKDRRDSSISVMTSKVLLFANKYISQKCPELYFDIV